MENLKTESLKKAHRKNHSFVKRLLVYQEIGILIPLLILVLAFSLASPHFLSAPNIFSVLKTLAFYGLVALGETLIIISGDIDISVGSVAGFGAVSSTFIMMKSNCFGTLGTPHEWVGVIAIIILTVAACSLFGFFNAFLIVNLKLPGFIATIGTLYIIRGGIMVITKGYPIYPLPIFFMDGIGKFQIFITSVNDTHLGFSLPFIVLILLIIAFEFLLRRTAFGRNIYATGSNREVARLSGIHTNRVRYMNFIITSMLAALSGIFVAAFTRQGYPPIGQGWELFIIASTAIGGASLTGGAGSTIGTFFGVLVMSVIGNGLVIIGLNTFLQQVVQGAIIIIAVYIDTLRRNQKARA